MEDNAIINDGDQAKLVPVTLKDHSKDPVLETKRERTALEKEVDAEIIAETCCAPKRKRGRPKKITKTELIREYYCGTCREKYLDSTVMKMPAGEGRWAIFCPVDQKMLTFLQPDLDSKVSDLIKNNPTK